MPVPYDSILPLKLRQGSDRRNKLHIVNIILSVPNNSSKQYQSASTSLAPVLRTCISLAAHEKTRSQAGLYGSGKNYRLQRKVSATLRGAPGKLRFGLEPWPETM